MNTRFFYPLSLIALLAFGATGINFAYAQQAEPETQQEEPAPKPEAESPSGG